MSLDLNDDKATLVQVMAWCYQATSHYLSQCWPRFMLSYAVTSHNELTDTRSIPYMLMPWFHVNIHDKHLSCSGLINNLIISMTVNHVRHAQYIFKHSNIIIFIFIKCFLNVTQTETHIVSVALWYANLVPIKHQAIIQTYRMYNNMFFVNTVQCRYNAVNFLHYPCNRYPIACLWVSCEFKVWSKFRHCHQSVICNIVKNLTALYRHWTVLSQMYEQWPKQIFKNNLWKGHLQGIHMFFLNKIRTENDFSSSSKHLCIREFQHVYKSTGVQLGHNTDILSNLGKETTW